MKIGLVCSDSLSLPGGIQEQVKGLYRFLKSKGHDVKIIAPKYTKDEDHGKDVIFLGMTMAFDYGGGSKANWSMIYDNDEIDAVLKREKFDILHFHSIGMFSTLQILRKSTSKNIVTYHILPEKSNTFKVFSNMIGYFMKDYLDKFSVGTVPSKPVLKYLIKDYVKIFMVVPNGIDLKIFNPSNKKIEKYMDGKVNILFVGRMDKRKGFHYLLKAYKSLKKKYQNIRLIAVGDGYSKEEYEKFAEENRLEDVVFAGYVKESELPSYYATCDIFCAPTVSDESFGLTIGEAIATGKPVIATNITGYKSVYGDSKGIVFVKPKSSKLISKVVENLISDENLRKKIGENGLVTAQKYSWDVVGIKFLKIYNTLVPKNDSKPSQLGIGIIIFMLLGMAIGFFVTRPLYYLKKFIGF